MEINYKADKVWLPFYKGDWDLAILIGGRGSAKTWNAGNFCVLNTLQNLDYRSLVLRDVSSSINQSILQNIKSRFVEVDNQCGNIFKKHIDIQESQVKNSNGEVMVLTKGFRTSRVEQTADLKGFEDIDLAIIEEAEDIRDEERANNLFDTLRKEGHKVIIILNTPDLEHWVIKRFFDYEKSDFDNYFTLKPKPIKGICQIITSYLDNKHLPEKTREKYASYGDKNSYNYKPSHYRKSILGLATEKQNLSRKFEINKLLNIIPTEPVQIVENVKIYKMPENGQIYSMGIDFAKGVGDKGDYSAISMRKYYKNEKGQNELVLQFKQRIGVRETARLAINLANHYNSKGGKVLLVPEINFEGVATMDTFLETYNPDWIYKRYSKDETKQGEILVPDYGWETNVATRPKMINDLSYAFLDEEIDMPNIDEIDEARNFIYVADKVNPSKGRYEAGPKSHDDLLFSDMICYQGFDYITKHV